MTQATASTAQDSWSLVARAQASLAAIRAGRGTPGKVSEATGEAATAWGDDVTPRLGVASKDLDGIHETLRQTDVFAGLDDRQLRRLAMACSEQSLAEHCYVFRRGDASDAVFVIREGTAVVLRDQRGRPVQVLARLQAGGIFGELGVLHGARRGASVRTAGPCRLLRIEKMEFLRLLEEHGTTAAKLEALAARRHCDNARAALDVNTRSDVRIRIDTQVTLVPTGERCQHATLEDISQGGLSLTGTPQDWQKDASVSFTLIAGNRRLQATGRIAWRRGETVGVCFTEGTAHQGHRVSSFTRGLLEKLT